MAPALSSLTALDAADRLRRGEISATDLARACLDVVAAREADIHAFVFLDPEHIIAQAEARDAARRDGEPQGPLHGIPVALKDIVDTADMPTRNGTPLDRDRRPATDATIVARLRAAGAVIFGKTVTTELAAMHPRETRNPYHLERTPGGSSSGSAAAVAAGMVPLAVGTQTNGSVIRPASFCGVIGLKPTYGLIPRTGVLTQSRDLDTVGVFARTIDDAALLVDVLAGHDPADPDSLRQEPRPLHNAASRSPTESPRIAFVRSPVWLQADAATRAAFEAFAASLGDCCTDLELPTAFDDAVRVHRTLNFAGMAYNYQRYYERGRQELSPFMSGAIEEGTAIPAVAFLQAREDQAALRALLDRLFDEHQVILTPAAPGEAPHGLGATGNPAFSTIWSLCGVPAITLPLLRGPSDLPLGIQLVGRAGEDACLLAIAKWLTQRFFPRAPN